jgi:hypothetical protein
MGISTENDTFIPVSRGRVFLLLENREPLLAALYFYASSAHLSFQERIGMKEELHMGLSAVYPALHHNLSPITRRL